MDDLYVVTGASRGLGEALARALRGRAATELVTIGRSEATIVADLGREAGIASACAALAAHCGERRYGKAVLVNNAGVVEPVAPVAAMDGAAAARNIAVNLVAPLRLMQAFLAATASATLRRVINVSSGAGRRPVPGWGAYCAAKAGLDMASRVAAMEAQARGEAVEVVSVAPGVIDTGMQEVVRGMDAARFPDVERFRRLKAEGALRSADAVAADLLRHEASGALFAQPLQDLREMA